MAHFSLGLVQRDNGDHVNAIISFETSLRLNPNHECAAEARELIEELS